MHVTADGTARADMEDAMARKPAAPLAEYHRKRDFARTAEPEGNAVATSGRRAGTPALAYVIQKHAASQLHFDLRLELDGVMKSWAVPKGPSLDPTVKRLAMQVEDHPIEYNTFEGTIPEGEYGGGTVMLWDRGTYTYGGPPGDEDPETALRAAYEKGDFKILLAGERLRGSWVLVRMRRGDDGRQWLLIKHRDEAASSDVDVVAEHDTSVAPGRTMEEIASGTNRVRRSDREAASLPTARKKTTKQAATKKVAAKRRAKPATEPSARKRVVSATGAKRPHTDPR
jgi:bifunctional non-homologous end joining protein LigD